VFLNGSILAAALSFADTACEPCGDRELAATAAVLARRTSSMLFSIAGPFAGLALVRHFT